MKNDLSGFVPDPNEPRMTTDKFITRYCQHYSIINPRPRITNKIWIHTLLDKLIYDYELVDKIKIREYLKKRSDTKKTYKQFYLTTLWWHVIKHVVLKRDGWKCRGNNCSTPDCKDLHVHHKTYAHKGEEINFLDDLITLCEVCHNKEHPEHADKLTKIGKRKRRKRIRKRRGVFELEAEVKMNSFEDKVENLRKADAENKAREAEKLSAWCAEKRVYNYDEMSDADVFTDIVNVLDEVLNNLCNI